MESKTKLAHGIRKPSKLLKGVEVLHRVQNKLRPPLPLFRALNRNKEKFECPICAYTGPFADYNSFAGTRRHAQCPACGALERHRIQYLVVKNVLEKTNSRQMRMLHFAPEKFLTPIFSRLFSRYETADLCMEGVDHKVDITNLPFKDGSYDFVYASHVLEHIPDDRKAVREVRRVLGRDGIAILPVPIVCEKTIEYSEPNPHEAGHVRAPAPDYFDRYKEQFGRVEVHASDSIPEKYQVFIYEDRSKWPTRECPLRPPMQGKRHSDYVPVCYV